ncbi:MAG: hypothetical protein EON85_12380 [Brevundimonas sp.]|nr:MAG: hypothetical protein EON85_12380 [Brevundimonas sp.]
MIRTMMALALMLGLATPGQAQEGPVAAFDAQARVTEALAAVRPIAMNRDQVDWAAVEARARGIAAEARDTVDLLPAYHLIVWSLRDEHSFMQPTPAQFDTWIARTNGRRYLPDTPRPRQSVSEFKRRPVSGRDLALPGGATARAVVVPAYMGQDENGAFAVSVIEALTATPTACGYVVDLRGNTGGNMGPMVGGLSPLLGEGYSTPAVAGPGLEDAVFRIERGQQIGYLTPDATEGVPLGALPPWPDRPGIAQAPVAVLLDQATASSGEATAIVFKGRAGTRFFGETTFGVASANQDIALSDGVGLFVTIALLKDSAGRTYPRGIAPDEAVETGPGDRRDPDDAVVEAAKGWLATQATCRAA